MTTLPVVRIEEHPTGLTSAIETPPTSVANPRYERVVCSSAMTSQADGDPNPSNTTVDASSDPPSAGSAPATSDARGDSETPSLPSRRSEERRLALLGLAVALMGALIGGLLSYLGAWQQARTQIEAQAAQNREDQKKEDRERRAEIYEELLGTADVYAVETNKIITDCKDGKCSPKWGEWQTARYNYQGALNHVWVFGSNDAVAQTGVISASLPDSLWLPSPDTLSLRFDSEKFIVAYQGFQFLMCRELPAQPRSDC